MKKSKNYCFILPTLHAGGLENYVLRYLTYASRINRYTIISLSLERGDLHDDFVKQKAEIHYINFGYLNFNKLRKFFIFLKTENIYSVVDFTGNFGGLRLQIAKWAGVESRIAFYRRSNNAFRNNFFRNLYNRFENRMVYINATSILSNSYYAFEFFFPLEHSQTDRFKVIRNGLNVNHFYKISDRRELRKKYSIADNTFVIGHIGRYDPAKNHDTIFKVASKLIKTETNILFLFCGKGTDSELFKDKLASLNILDHCLCLGLIADVNAILNILDVFYFPSIAEGQPNALIEALLVELPIVTSNIPSILETMPANTHKNLLDPIKYDDHIDALLKIKHTNKTHEISSYKLREWAKEKYDSNKNFKIFENEL